MENNLIFFTIFKKISLKTQGNAYLVHLYLYAVFILIED